MPPLPPQDQYGNLLMDRRSSAAGQLPVSFSHWLHRQRHNCRVCHSELEFAMEAEGTVIGKTDHDSGRFCGACHDGRTAFATTGSCESCHNGDIRHGSEKFLPTFSPIPYAYAPYGNGIDWAELQRQGLIDPARYLKHEVRDVPFDRELTLDAEWCRIPPAVFPHKAHTEWLECNSCHPGIFNIKKKTTRHFRMNRILKGEFCGACHMKVAFPMNDCERCHPGINIR
nr:hypothetical protein [Desulfuromonadales bacterium]